MAPFADAATVGEGRRVKVAQGQVHATTVHAQGLFGASLGVRAAGGDAHHIGCVGARARFSFIRGAASRPFHSLIFCHTLRKPYKRAGDRHLRDSSLSYPSLWSATISSLTSRPRLFCTAGVHDARVKVKPPLTAKIGETTTSNAIERHCDIYRCIITKLHARPRTCSSKLRPCATSHYPHYLAHTARKLGMLT